MQTHEIRLHASKVERGVKVSIPMDRSQMPRPESTAEYSVTKAVSCG
jgi:hypothetical protein